MLKMIRYVSCAIIFENISQIDIIVMQMEKIYQMQIQLVIVSSQNYN